MPRIVIAPDSFKGSTFNVDVATWIRLGWKSVRPNDVVIEKPMADGGEGTVETIAQNRDDVEKFTISVVGADGGSNRATWLLFDNGSAVVELASASGITLVKELDALGCHTYGLGQVLQEVSKHPEVTKIFIALGGSASTDGGTGALRALGFSFLDELGDELSLGGAGLVDLAEIDTSNFIKPPRGGVVCLVDVSNPLLGDNGAAAVFGPQKGATPEDIQELESGLARFVEVCGVPDSPGSGAAGGTAYGFRAAWGATFAAGSAIVSEMVGLPQEMEKADLVITGEGQLDSQSWNGKVVGYVRSLAGALDKPVAYVVGNATIDFPDDAFLGLSLTSMSGSKEEAIASTGEWLFAAGKELAEQYSLSLLSS